MTDTYFTGMICELLTRKEIMNETSILKEYEHIDVKNMAKYWYLKVSRMVGIQSIKRGLTKEIWIYEIVERNGTMWKRENSLKEIL